MAENVGICGLLLEKYGGWEPACRACGMDRLVVEAIDEVPQHMSLGMVRDIAHALGMSTPELVQLVVED